MAWKICLFVFWAIGCSSGQDHPRSTFADIKESITLLQKDFNATLPDVADGGDVFLHRLKSSLWSQDNERKILLAQMISTYLELLSTATKSHTSAHVKELLEALTHYKEKYSESLKKAKDIIELSKLPLSDLKIQRKVILEMYSVLLEVNKEENRRKRRSRGQNPRDQKRCRPNLMG
uniref:Interferon gamma n=1 Tax=Pogona vitticeps TaxID=103695 RepID=A0A6J0SZ56_9SAUR